MNPLRCGQFRRYFAGHTLSTFGDSLVPLTLAFAALQVGGVWALGLVLAANRVPIAALVLFGGVLGDRWNRRTVMLGADLLRAGTQIASGLLLITGHAGLWHLVVLQALAGAGTAVFVPAASGLVPALVPAERLQQANALLGLAGNVNKVLAISTAGVLVATAGPGVALLVDAATFAASALALASLRIPPGHRATGRTSLSADVAAGARLVWQTRWLRTLLGYAALLQALVIGPHMVAGPLLAAEVYGGAGAWAAIGVVQAIGSIAGGMAALRWQPRRPLVSAVALGLLMVPYLAAFALAAPLWLVAAAAVLVGAQGSVFLAVQATALQDHVPAEARSRVAAWSQLGNLVLLPASLAAAGPLVDELGGRLVLTLGGAWLVVSTVGVLVSGALNLSTTKATSSPAGAAAQVSAATP